MMELAEEKFVLSDPVKKEIDRWIEKYPPDQKKSAIVKALLLAQEQNGGWLSDVAMNAVADYLDVPHIVAYEAATFYDMYNLKPIGKNKISVCTNVPCMLRGSDEIIDCLKKRLQINVGETTKDGLFTIKEVECMAACAAAPMCQINDKKYHEHLTPEKMLGLIDRLEQEAKTNAK